MSGHYMSIDAGDGSSQQHGGSSPRLLSHGGSSPRLSGPSSPGPGNMKRVSSFAKMRNSVISFGEQAQTQFLDRNLEAHSNAANQNNKEGDALPVSMRSVSSIPRMISNLSVSSAKSYNSLDVNFGAIQTLRFQVIVWSIGCPDVKNNLVSMKFRVTLYWNDIDDKNKTQNTSSGNSESCSSHDIWAMSGRSSAYKKTIAHHPSDMIDVPPISILNAESFEIIGQPEVQLLREDNSLMRWSCMYRAKLHQDNVNVHEFPHDCHNLELKLGILSQRQPGRRWDRRKWKLGLANESDTQGTISIPQGVIVDHVKIPEFQADPSGLNFSLSELKHGTASAWSGPAMANEKDFYLSVKVKVKRESGYYDKNIMPLLSMLNLVSISILTQDGDHYFQRALMCLNIAFVEVGMRMSLDSRLPSVGYQIKLQRILNRYFYSILSIVLESSVLQFLIENGEWTVASTRKIDFVWAILLLLNQAYLQLVYTSFDSWRQGGDAK